MVSNILKTASRYFACGLLCAVVPAFATKYYVNSSTGADANPGTDINAPWKSMTPVMAKTFQPGDTVNFARGSSWTKAAWEYLLLVDDNGAANQPIVFRPYGTGEMPTFSSTNGKYNKPIKVTASYVIFDSLKIIQGYNGFEFREGANHNIVRNCEISGCGGGVLCYGAYNLFTKNYVHDLVTVVDDLAPGNDYGCVSFWFYAQGNEVSYNTSINNICHSYDYTWDGGFVECYTNTDSTYVHHNWAEVGMGVVEASDGHGKDMKFYHNIFIDTKGMFAFHWNNFTLSNFRFENNTCINRGGTLWNNLFNFSTASAIPNNAVIMRNNIFVCGGDASEHVADNSNFVHENNLYYLLDGAQLGSFSLGSGEKLGDPLFVNETGKDLQLQSSSPAKDAGMSLGYTTDFLGNPVPSGSAPDMGAFEFQATTGVQHNSSAIVPHQQKQQKKMFVSHAQAVNGHYPERLVNIRGAVINPAHSGKSLPQGVYMVVNNSTSIRQEK